MSGYGSVHLPHWALCLPLCPCRGPSSFFLYIYLGPVFLLFSFEQRLPWQWALGEATALSASLALTGSPLGAGGQVHSLGTARLGRKAVVLGLMGMGCRAGLGWLGGCVVVEEAESGLMSPYLVKGQIACCVCSAKESKQQGWQVCWFLCDKCASLGGPQGHRG